MTNLKIERPAKDEYSKYFEGYVSLVPEGDVVAMLETEIGETLKMLGGISESDALFRYAPEKWIVKEVVGHLIDAERVFAYRALCVARGDTQSLPGFDENEYMNHADFNRRPLADLIAELEAARRSTVLLFKSFDAESWTRRGIANEIPVTTRALVYIVVGHELHHRRILNERYLSAGNFKNRG